MASPSSASAYRPHPAYRPNQIDLNLLVGLNSSILVCLVSKPGSQDGLVGAALVNWALPVVEARPEKCAGSFCILDISCFFLNQVGFGDFFCCETQLSAGELLVAGRQPPLE